MDKPVREAELFFSQPVRQIAMMLLVCALVGAGGYVAYGPIFSIFIANPWLNGLILGVFVLGVLTCFWQVAQLVRSVSWIEGFAAHRPGHEITVPPRMLAPLAALLRSRGKRGGQISSSSARSIQDSVATRIDEARDITRYLTSLLIFLGLLGTFYGLAITVPAVVDTIRALAPQEGETGLEVFDKLMGGLEKQLGGMGTAFSSSLLGLAGSLVVGLLELFAGHGQNRFYRELEEWLTSFTRLSFSGGEADGGIDQETVSGVLDHMADQVETLQEILRQSDEGRSAVNDRLEELATSVEGLTRQLESEVGSIGVLTHIAEGQERLIRIIEKAAEDENAGGVSGGSEAESRMRLRSIDVQLLKLLEEVAAGRQESMADLRGDLAELTRAVRALGRTDARGG
ncbi:biopolymer transporter ExbB [Defluviimonas sp. WL0050]|uniref:Biopolymer transporter ExbB n=1 Tax=Albidovulum litorale TaxID=2984134 RepID=A0ABT2ZSX3_9RHOB|nr:biopolymer transporter ExbB [Defluviimonas sp. WL0050]MCV2874260.1 biopolymer transporter ExbB [Defluviimonas sp. WL0050]